MQIVTILSGVTNVYAVAVNDAAILIDTGQAFTANKVLRVLSRYSFFPKSIRAIILTHAHYDHIGAAAILKKKIGAPVLIHQVAAPILEKGEVILPKGSTPTGKFMLALGGKQFQKSLHVTAVKPDIVIQDRYDLSVFGIPAHVIHTPGHTKGSLSVVFNSGDAFVGDTLFQIVPGAVYPPFADCPELLPQSWQCLIDNGARRFYPGHGMPISLKRVVREINRRKK